MVQVETEINPVSVACLKDTFSLHGRRPRFKYSLSHVHFVY